MIDNDQQSRVLQYNINYGHKLVLQYRGSCTHISVVSVLRCEELHDFSLGGMGSNSVACIKVRMARTEEIPFVTFATAAADTI